MHFVDAEARCTPLHILLYNDQINNLHENAQYIIQADPSILQRVNEYEALPLHAACSNKNITSETIQLLVDTWPEATHKCINWGGLALHCLCCENWGISDSSAVSILKILLEANPGSVSQITIDGWRACNSSGCEENVA